MFSEIVIKLEGLAPSSEYCAELVASNASGTVYGGQRRFTTPAQKASSPLVATDGASATGPTTATVEGNADPEGQPTTVHADYALASDLWCTSKGTSGTPVETPSQPLGSDNAMFSEIVIKLERLASSSEYCAELIASNASGTAYGGQRSFATPAKPSPPTSSPPTEVVTEPAEVTLGGVGLKGRLNPGGLPTTYYFEYRSVTCDELPSCVKRTATGGPITGDTQQQVPPIEVIGLAPGTTYTYRLIASSAEGNESGSFLTFTTSHGMSEPEPKLEPLIPQVIPPITISPSTTVLKPLTKAQQLARALRACHRKPKKQRRACVKLAHEKYGMAARKAHQQASGSRR
jgi:hypothetical protein